MLPRFGVDRLLRVAWPRATPLWRGPAEAWLSFEVCGRVYGYLGHKASQQGGDIVAVYWAERGDGVAAAAELSARDATAWLGDFQGHGRGAS